MKRVFSFFLVCLCLCLCLAVPAFAAPSSDDALLDGLGSNWTDSNVGYPSGYGNSWFWRVIELLRNGPASLKSGWSTSYPSGFSSSFYARLISEIRSVGANLDLVDISIDALLTPLQTISNNSGYIHEDTGAIDSRLAPGGAIYGFLSKIQTYTSTFSSSGSVYNFLSGLSSNSDSLKTLLDEAIPYMKDRLYNINVHSYNTRYLTEDLLDSSLVIQENSADIRFNSELLADFSSDLASASWKTFDSSSWYRQIFDSLYTLKDFFASETDVAVKDSSHDELSAFAALESSSFRGTDISSLGGFQSDFKNWFELRDIPIDATFDYVESGYSSWFSQGTADALSVGGGSAAVSGVAVVSDPVEVDTPYLDAYERELDAILSGGD